MEPLTRRAWLESAALAACGSCTCLAQASEDCCTVPEAPAEAIRFQPGFLAIDLDRTLALRRTGAAVKIVDPARNVRVIIARPAKDLFVALDQKCTHGGGSLTYVHKHKHLYCTCWGHAKFALDGSVLRWPNNQAPRPLRAHPVERSGNLLVVRVEGLV